MARQPINVRHGVSRWAALTLLAGLWLTGLPAAHAVPAFARQTGQNCVACHAGGQFPELTPYGRLFKMTGYTIGERTLPLSVMAAGGVSSMSNVTAVNNSLANNAGSGLSTPVKNGSPHLDVGSLFLAGKISDNIGAFAQFTWDNYARPNTGGDNVLGHAAVDNMDLRWADHYIAPGRDVIVGVSLNNNPSVSDPWNTSWAWMQYVPSSGGIGSNAYLDANAPYPSSGLPGDFYPGLTAYAFVNRSIYGEIGFYRGASGLLRFMNAGNDLNNSRLRGSSNPYWRLAWNPEWGAHNLMVGTSGMMSRPYDNANAVSPYDLEGYQRVRTRGVDAQYQYLLDPHAITAQLTWQHQEFTPSSLDAANNGSVLTSGHAARARLSYTWNARYGGALTRFNQSGDFATASTGSGIELFYMPVQYARIGVQYTAYSRLASIDTPSNANTTSLYVWVAY